MKTQLKEILLFPQVDVISPLSTSDEDDGVKKLRKLDKKMIRERISKFFRRKIEKEKEERDGQDCHPHRPPRFCQLTHSLFPPSSLPVSSPYTLEPY